MLLDLSSRIADMICGLSPVCEPVCVTFRFSGEIGPKIISKALQITGMNLDWIKAEGALREAPEVTMPEG